ncbi:TonB-dependent receptor plug domain-containing protein [Roseateles koreensis]|uniref:TonB-dependent receptor n=1 Tax=Roseateles koreensis TaxID=2987526 RepID=A0ABT5KM08_9BURK|nr:TonB-dependent receptor [Roseateles koreensis]MDC8783867.1 TonB-dependent receptor [Roseateles koreensis]
MFKKTPVVAGVLLALSGVTTLVSAQTTLERVEVTGSSVKRIESETALPITVLKKSDIARTGATNVTDLLQKLPAMQNSTNEGSAVGGETFGFAGISIHNIGETRTLVLLNGHRISKFGGQTVTGSLNAIDLNTLPISAIERVEILTDGASALYGADAVAGVVNFITVRNSTEGTINAGVSLPTHAGAEEKRISLTKGFGNFEADGFNVNVALSYDKRGTLAATQRDFAKTGLVTHTDSDGILLGVPTANATSKRSVPANLNLYDADGNQLTRINPTLAATGACPAYHVKSGNSCRYDFTSQLEIYPDRERTNGYVTFDKKLGDDIKWSTELLVSHTKSTSRIAPPPGELPVQVGSAAYNTAIALAASKGYFPIGTAGVDAAHAFDPTTMDANLRFTELGKRTNVNEIDLTHFVTGVEGSFSGWDYSTSFTHSENTVKDTFGGGYASVSGVAAATFTEFNPFLPFGAQSAAGQKAIDGAKLSGYWNGGKSTLQSLNGQASHDLGKLDGGTMQIGLGFSLQREKLDSRPGDVLAGRVTYKTDANNQPCAASGLPCVGTAIDQRFGDSGITPAYNATRDTQGVFSELVMPFTKSLEVTASGRFDHTSDFGNTTNGKLAVRYQPVKELLVRGSVGTGYLAPSIAQVNAPKQNYGVTAGAYSCTDGSAAATALQALATAKGLLCDDGAQFQQYAMGYKNLKPETSHQFTFGALWEPTADYSFGADYWAVYISDSIGSKTEQVVFADPNKYASNFTDFVDPLTGKKLLAVIFPNENLGKSITSGIDFSLRGRFKLAGGKLTSNLNATYLLVSKAQQEVGGAYLSDIENKDQTGSVSFRWQGRWINTFDLGDWSNTATVNFKSGYNDSAVDAAVKSGPNIGTTRSGYRQPVPWFYTLDLTSTYAVNKSFSLTGGVLNLFDRNPPFVFSQAGTSRGQEVGWDGRYYDPRGRTIFANASYKF